VEALAQVMRSLLADPGVAGAMGRLGRAKVLREHTWEIQCQRLARAVDRAMARAR
jgi:hypothetical protein